MTNAVSIIRGLLIYSICVPLAVFLGYLLANPLDARSLYTVVLVLCLLLLPILLKWHHLFLILAWNTTTVIFLIPGQPNVWMLLAGLSLLVTWLQYALHKGNRPQSVPSVTWPLLFLGAVILVTAYLTGGIGFRAFGSEVGGGKRYVALLGAIVGYFALSAQRIAPEKARLYAGLFFAGGLTLAMGSMGSYVSPDLYFLFWVFPVDSLILPDPSEPLGAVRLTGVSMAGVFAIFLMLAHFGIRRLLDLRHPLRIMCFAAAWIAILMGGYRSYLLLALGVSVFHFYLEGLHRTTLMPIFAILGIAAAALLIPFSTSLPITFQRALSVLGVPVAPEVAMDVYHSNQWRIGMWQRVAPQIPDYLLVGKGYGLRNRDLDLSVSLGRTRGGSEAEGAELAQDYHNGPLSVILPLGLGGVLAVLWLWWAGFKLLIRNYRYGAPHLSMVNTLLLALFSTKVAFFLMIFGALNVDLVVFTGILGLSVALNGGMARRAPAPAVAEAKPEPKPSPVLPRPRPALGRSVTG